MALHAACRVCAHAHTQHAQARTRTCYKNEDTQQLESAAVRRSEAGPDDAAGRTVSPGDLRSPASITHSCARLRDKPKYCLYGHWQTKGTEAEGDEGTCQRSRNYVVCSRDGLRTKPAVGRPLHRSCATRHPLWDTHRTPVLSLLIKASPRLRSLQTTRIFILLMDLGCGQGSETSQLRGLPRAAGSTSTVAQ